MTSPMSPAQPIPIDVRTLVTDALGSGASTFEGSWADMAVTSIEFDSRRVGPGSVFCAVPGLVHDGHDFADAAAAAGAVVAIVERPVDAAIAQIEVADVRSAMPLLAARLFDHPSADIPVVGVTGTNGKTTMTHMIVSIAAAAGRPATTIGTLSGERTTPEGPELQRQLREAASAEHALVALEVSSHALTQHRVDGTNFAVSVFTNLTPDHLDYHGSMQDYFAAKASLFDDRTNAAVVVVDDDEWGERIARDRPDATVVDAGAVRAAIEERTPTHTTFAWNGARIALPLVGDFNVINATCAAHVTELLGFAPKDIKRGLENLDRIAGRMDRVPDLPVDAPQVFVDYSHTPDSLTRALVALRQLGTGRVIVVFGCGGDRDRSKRPLMGAAAALNADIAVVTSDNPRTEDAASIIAAIMSGIEALPAESPDIAEVIVDGDRRHAIARALDAAEPSDLVLIAGKGHETTQTIGTTSHPFDDRVEVQQYWAAAS